MVKECLQEKCYKYPIYNLPNEKIGIYCKEHKKDNMVNVVSKKCLEGDCNKQPSFNLPNEKVGRYCKEHKKDNMVDVISKSCLESDCDKQPNYNVPNEKIGKYCKEHKQENMINVISKRCQETNCNKQPSYNVPNEKIGKYCKEHKQENMINVISKRCVQEKCDTYPVFNFKNENYGKYCKKHSKVGMVDVLSKICLDEICETRSKNNKYKGYCLRCFLYKFPDIKTSINYKIKENHMTDFIKEQFKDEKIVFDKTIYGGSSKRRPDVYINKLTHIIIGECDENQHDLYENENIRVIELLKDVGEKPVVFIRFNPDSYLNENGKKIPSSFKLDKITGNVIIRDSKEWENRLNVLKEYMNKHLVTVPKKDITYEYLFYDINKISI